MGVEIERKFLIQDSQAFRELLPTWKKLTVTQGYLCHHPSRQVRIRTVVEHCDPIWITQAFITIKGVALGLSVPEYEYAIPYTEGADLLLMCDGGRITKDRYKVGRWEVDVFKGENAGLLIAEIELTSEDEPIEAPPFWIEKEVTGDNRYSNLNLSIKPYSQW